MKIKILLCFLAFANLIPLQAQRVANTTLNLPVTLPTGDYEIKPPANNLEIASILAIASPPGTDSAIYLAERPGRIQVLTDIDAGTFAPSPFLDISSRVSTNLENGLLGLAFHPQYETNGYFYVFYTTSASGLATTRLSRFTRSSSDPLIADPSSEQILFDQRDEASNHNGGALAFGLDGYLYVTVGDEGGGGDSYQNGQRIDKDLFAGLLRLDVDKLSTNIEPTAHPAIPRDSQNRAPFSIPVDNPLVPTWQTAGADPDSNLRLEFYAIGLRNPWHMDIDPLTGDIWISDVGQDSWEEINIIQKGGNYGWPIREGAHSYNNNRSAPPEFGPLLDPVFEYGRAFGVSVSGGIVYRGSALPELYGAYIFSDIFSNRAWITRWNAESATYETTEFSNLYGISAYGRDPSDGEMITGNHWGGFGKLVRADSSTQPEFPSNLSATGAFSDLANLSPEAGIYAYEPKLPFWSDHAIKSRWVSIPGTEQVGYSQDQAWNLPTGSVWVKHFELETEQGNAATRKRIETRFIVKTEDGAYGLSYQWNENGSEATLVPPEGVSIDIAITRDGQSLTQTWNIPSRQQCLSCHTPAAGYALSFNTRQLNKPGQHDGQSENTLSYFSRLGILDTDLSETSGLPQHYTADDAGATLEQQARSYLAVNCYSCHQPNGGTPASWDARPHISLEQTGLINGIVANNGGDPNKRLVVPGSPEDSLILDRMAARDGFRRMPPIGSNILDEAGIQLVTAWISSHGAASLFETWQIQYFGSASEPNASANADPDGDGNSNRLEFLTNTSPLDPSSKWTPQFTRDRSSLTVRFALIPQRTFVIQRSTDLSAWTDWQAAGNPPQADPEQTTEAHIQGLLDPSEPKAFFRVTVED